ncbi:MAG: hypothetical protein GXP55_23260 [Deltaproteobacteria bacterium]|nr:hypothetical protein [Deltaproteobacteria bacterium]
MTQNDAEWKPSAALPRKPTAEDQERVAAIEAPELCAPKDRKILWVQRLESATIEAGFGAHERTLEVLHPDYEELTECADSIAWQRLAANPREAGYRGASAPSLRMKTVMTRAHEQLAELQERSDAEDLRLVVHGEDVAIVARKRWRWAVGLESGELLGHWRGVGGRQVASIQPVKNVRWALVIASVVFLLVLVTIPLPRETARRLSEFGVVLTGFIWWRAGCLPR